MQSPQSQSPERAPVNKSIGAHQMRDGTWIKSSIYTPTGVHPMGVAIFCHGGAFSSGNEHADAGICVCLAKLGLVVVCSNFRQGEAHPHPAATHDLEDITRHVRSVLYPGVKCGIVGYSSGGYHSLSLSQHPPDGVPYAFCIATNPVAHPGHYMCV